MKRFLYLLGLGLLVCGLTFCAKQAPRSGILSPNGGLAGGSTGDLSGGQSDDFFSDGLGGGANVGNFGGSTTETPTEPQTGSASNNVSFPEPDWRAALHRMGRNLLGIFLPTQSKKSPPPVIIVREALVVPPNQKGECGALRKVSGKVTLHSRAYAKCPPGYTIAGGGAGCQVPPYGGTMHHTFPKGNGWDSSCCIYADPGTAPTGSFAYAVCQLVDPDAAPRS